MHGIFEHINYIHALIYIHTNENLGKICMKSSNNMFIYKHYKRFFSMRLNKGGKL